MIYFNFLSKQFGKNKYVKATKEWLPAIFLAIILFYVTINIVIYVIPVILDFLAQSVTLLGSMVSGETSTTSVFGGNTFTVFLMLLMPVTLFIFIRMIGFGGFRGDYGML